jgi:RimJ/RimL family protein N-acetyltransferase
MLSSSLHKCAIEGYISGSSHLGTSLRPICVEDAEFVLELRNNDTLNRHISSTSTSVSSQKQWIRDYLVRYESGQEAYFIIVNGGKPRGTIRIYNYDARSSTTTYGSWLLAPDSPASCAFSSTILNHDLCFNVLKFTRIVFDVRTDNKSVWRFHEGVGARFIHEGQKDRFYEITSDIYPQVRTKLEKLAKQLYERPIP